MKVNIIGPIFGTSGFNAHTKQFANALHEQGCEVRIDSPKPQGWELLVNDTELLMLNREPSIEAISILIGQPQYLPFVWSENPKDVIPFIIWEGSKVPEYWLEYLCDKRIKQIWCPSNHVKNALINTINHPSNGFVKHLPTQEFENKIKIVPHGVDLNLFKPNPEVKKPEGFTFLVNKGWSQGKNDRGGVQFTLQAYCEEFTKDEEVQMLVKINPAYITPGWDVKKEIEKLGIEKNENSPSLMFTDSQVDFKLMPEFYNGDVFISSTMAEAFNLPVMEAMAMGMPVITTNFGGQIDFVNEDNGWLLDGELIEVTWDKVYEGVEWKKPDVTQLRKVMRECFENKDKCEEKGKLALEEAQKWSWPESAKKAVEFLKEL